MAYRTDTNNINSLYRVFELTGINTTSIQKSLIISVASSGYLG